MAASSQQQVFSYLSGLKQNYPSLSALVAQCETLWQKKLYHQLTDVVDKIVPHPDLKAQKGLLEFYGVFLRDFEDKINPKKLMEFALIISKEHTEPAQAISFLQTLGNKVRGDPAYVLPLTEIATLQLATDDIQACRDSLEQARVVLDEVVGVDNVLHGSYHRALALCFKQRDMKTEFFKNALMYLSCVNLDTLSKEEQVEIAFDLGLAALLSDTIYNFGELLGHPILASLENTSQQWIVPFLKAFNAGQIDEFQRLSRQYAKEIQSVPDIASNDAMLKDKITLLRLVEMLFARPPLERATVSFSDVVDETGLPIEQVEYLVMRALSLGLIRGAIDEIEQKICVTWVQQRILDKDQLAKMSVRLEEWSASVHQTLVLMENETGELAT